LWFEHLLKVPSAPSHLHIFLTFVPTQRSRPQFFFIFEMSAPYVACARSVPHLVPFPFVLNAIPACA
jgi:hypothetical protein